MNSIYFLPSSEGRPIWKANLHDGPKNDVTLEEIFCLESYLLSLKVGIIKVLPSLECSEDVKLLNQSKTLKTEHDLARVPKVIYFSSLHTGF